MKIKPYVFRKILHMIAVCITVVILLRIDTWYHVAYACLFAIALIYPLLSLFEKYQAYHRFFVEKGPGEVKLSLVLLFVMLMVLSTVGWGLFHERYLVLAALLMWGLGDASAALIGIPYGRHKIGRKSVEGSLAMLVVAFVSGLIVLYNFEPFSLTKTLLVSFVSAAIAMLTEFFSDSRFDTFSVPIMTLAVLLLLKSVL